MKRNNTAAEKSTAVEKQEFVTMYVNPGFPSYSGRRILST
jgi:hypothetical protein